MPMTRGRSSESGFTLIELMIVVVILGVLAALVIPNYGRFVRNSKCARTASELRSLSTAFVAYQASYGDFPPDSRPPPPGMEEFINPALWADAPLGGTYNWEGPDTYG